MGAHVVFAAGHRDTTLPCNFVPYLISRIDWPGKYVVARARAPRCVKNVRHG